MPGLTERLVRLLLAALILVPVLGTAEVALETRAASLTNSRPMQITLRQEINRDRNTHNRAYVTCGSSQFAWLLPPGFRMDRVSPERVVFVSNSHDCFVAWRVVEGLSPGAAKANRPLLRALLAREYPGSRIARESTRSAGNNSGPTFDLRWVNDSGTSEAARVMYIPSAAGVMEFSMLSRADRYEQGLLDLNTVLVSFAAAGPGQNLEIAAISNRL